MKKRGAAEARWGNVELATFMLTLAVMAFFNWRFIVYFLPFMYLGHCMSYLNGYYRHFGGNTEEPIAWGVSSYGKVYNWIFFNNGYHAEHHFRPKCHWTKMHAFLRADSGTATRGRHARDQHAAHARLPRSQSAEQEPSGRPATG